MVVLDGSRGEGGGQSLRTALVLAAVMRTPLSMERIRANRPKPGLAPQHLATVRALADLCGARVEGDEPRSQRLTFEPGALRGGAHRWDIGTAGSATLLAQSAAVAAAFAPEPTELSVGGGTDVPWAPPWDHFERVVQPLVRACGLDVAARVERRGFVPKGGGRVAVDARPSRPGAVVVPPVHGPVGVRVVTSALPPRVDERVAAAAEEALRAEGLPAKVALERVDADSPGGVVTVVRGGVGGSALAERGVPSEEVGRRAARSFLATHRTGADVDEHTADQLMLPAALAARDGASSTYTAPTATEHARTNAWVLEAFLPVRWTFEREGTVVRFRVAPVGGAGSGRR